MSTEIDIKDLELKKVIYQLWKFAEYSSFYNNVEDKPEFNFKNGAKDVKPGGQINNFCGKMLNLVITSKYIYTTGYDLLYGQGKAAEIISNLQ